MADAAIILWQLCNYRVIAKRRMRAIDRLPGLINQKRIGKMLPANIPLAYQI